MGKRGKERFFRDSGTCLKGYFGVERGRVRGNGWGLYASLRRRQAFQVGSKKRKSEGEREKRKEKKKGERNRL